MRGVGGSVRCSVAHKWPVGLFGRPGEILSVEVPDSEAPLLLSRATQRSLGCVIDLGCDQVDFRALDVFGAKA
eukprot:14477940-Alexandrium_andersonii.AAC.1